jgi:hypothetical protein
MTGRANVKTMTMRTRLGTLRSILKRSHESLDGLGEAWDDVGLRPAYGSGVGMQVVEGCKAVGEFIL